MDYKSELKAVIGVTSFETFWDLLKFLLDNGYNDTDAFGVAMLGFNETEMWKDVGFIRLEGYEHESSVEVMGADVAVEPIRVTRSTIKTLEFRMKIVVGIIDEDMKHMSSAFDVYRDSISKGVELNISVTEPLENNLRVIKFSGVDELYLRMLGDISKRYYGYDALGEELKREINKREERIKRGKLRDSIRQNNHI
jgi:hypothetical protein